MANKTLHSLQFPGLSDTYIIPEQAPEFSTSSTYSVGEYVTYQGLVYKCKEAVTTAGSWTGSTNWDSAEISADLQSHVQNISNPHLVTKTQIGLDNVANERQYSANNPNFSSDNPQMDGSASPGIATTYARSDHVHGTDTTRMQVPENAGSVGQILTKTSTGSIWQNAPSGGDTIAAASNSYSVTLYAASWSSAQQTISTPTGATITNTSDGVLALSSGATAAQLEAFQMAKIVVVSQSSSGVVVQAYGTVPTINLPCELMLFMKADYYTKSETNNLLDSKANLASPALTGTPTAPTAAANTNNTQLATTAFVKTANDNMVLRFENQAVSAASTSQVICTISNAAITANHVVTECTFAAPANITSDLSWTTSSGSLTFSGTASAATTLTCTLVKKGN